MSSRSDSKRLFLFEVGSCNVKIFFLDTEFKINKKLMELASAKGIKPHSAASGSLTYSTIFPTIPVAIGWQQMSGLGRFDENWLLQSAMTLNPKVAGGLGLYAITKLDISFSDVEELPVCVFRLQSLRILNASNNRISKFHSLDLCRNSLACQCSVLQVRDSTFVLRYLRLCLTHFECVICMRLKMCGSNQFFRKSRGSF